MILCNTYLEYTAESKAGLNTHSNKKDGQETLIPSVQSTKIQGKHARNLFPLGNGILNTFVSTHHVMRAKNPTK